jgi:hypothetical protein
LIVMRSRVLRALMAMIAAAAVGFGGAGVAAPADHGTDHVAVKCYDWCDSPQP